MFTLLAALMAVAVLVGLFVVGNDFLVCIFPRRWYTRRDNRKTVWDVCRLDNARSTPRLPAQRGGVPFVNVAFLWMNLDRLDDDDAFDLLEEEDWIVSRLSRMTFLLLFRLSFV